MNELIILLGSNLEDRKGIIASAVKEISRRIGEVVSVSKLYETAAWGNEAQPGFINQVVITSTDKPALECLDITQTIETDLGRVRHERWGPRLIDIDILFYNDLVKEENDLIVPHPQLHKRRFTLVPLCELVPEMEHPIFKKTMEELLRDCHDELEVKMLN